MLLLTLLLASAALAQYTAPNCANVRCKSGYVCSDKEGALCVPIPEKPTCANKKVPCPGGQTCDDSSGTARCVEACALAKCGPSETCVHSPKMCLIAPCPQFDCVDSYDAAPSRKPVFQILSGTYGSFVYHLIDTQGDSVLQSVSTFTSEQAAAASADSVRVNGVVDANWVLSASELSLKAGNGVVVAMAAVSSMAEAESTKSAIMALLKTDDVKTVPPITSSVGIGQFEIFYDIAAQFRFRLKGANGEIILASEGYTRKASALKGIASVRLNADAEANFAKLDSADSQFYFNLMAQNNMVVGTSEMYRSTANRAIGIFSVQRNAPRAPIVDLTIGVTKPAAPKASYELYQETSTDYRFRLTLEPGIPLLASTSYATKNDAMTALNAAKAAAASAASYETKPAASSSTSNYAALNSGGKPVAYTPIAANSYTAQVQTAVIQYGGSAEVDDQTSTRSPKFVIFCGKCVKPCFYWHLKAANGEIILASESYTSKASAKTGIASVKANVNKADAFNKLLSTTTAYGPKQPYFTLEAVNGETIGVSEMYATTSSRDAGIDAVIRNALAAVEVDEASMCAGRLSQVIKPYGYAPKAAGGAAKREDEEYLDDEVMVKSSANNVALSLALGGAALVARLL